MLITGTDSQYGRFGARFRRDCRGERDGAGWDNWPSIIAKDVGDKVTLAEDPARENEERLAAEHALWDLENSREQRRGHALFPW